MAWGQVTLFTDDQGHDLPASRHLGPSYFFLLPICFALLYYSLVLFSRYVSNLAEVLKPRCLPAAQVELVEIAKQTFTRPALNSVRGWFLGVGLAVVAFNTVANLFPGESSLRPSQQVGWHQPSRSLCAGPPLLAMGVGLPAADLGRLGFLANAGYGPHQPHDGVAAMVDGNSLRSGPIRRSGSTCVVSVVDRLPGARSRSFLPGRD